MAELDKRVPPAEAGPDITHRMEADQSLQDSEQPYRTLFDSDPHPMWVFDVETLAFLAVNKAAVDHYGYSRDEFLAMTIKDVRPEEEIPLLMRDLGAAEESVEPTREWRHRKKDGSIIDVLVTAHALSFGGRRARVVRVEDVSERHRAAERLVAAERKYRALVERIPVVTYVSAVDEVGSSVFVSPQIEDVLGYTPEEWLAEPELWLRSIHPEDRLMVLGEHVRTNTTGDPFRVEYRLAHRDGRYVWVRDEGVLVRADDGRPQFWQGVMLDISGRKRVDATLLMERRLLEMVAASASLQEVLEALAREIESLVPGMLASVLLLDADRHELRYGAAPSVPPHFVKATEGTRLTGSAGSSGASILQRRRVIARDIATDPRWEEIRDTALGNGLFASWSAPILSAGDEVLGTMTMYYQELREPTSMELDLVDAASHIAGIAIERQRAETQLRKAEARTRALIEQMPAVTYVDDIDEAWETYVSPQVEGLLGYSPEEWTTDPMFREQRMHPEDRHEVMAAYRRSRRTGEPFDAQYRMFARDGHLVWVHDRASVVLDEGGHPAYVQGVIFDVTEGKRAEEDLQRSFQLLRQTDEERRVLLSRLVRAQEEERRRIAGDIHDDSIQVLTALSLRLEMLRRYFSAPDQQQALSNLEDTLAQATGRLRHLLFELRPPALDREGLAAALRLYLDQIQADFGLGYRLRNELEAEPPQETRAMLYRIAQEALTNVRKHAEASEVEVSLVSTKGGYLVNIQDNGNGFHLDDVVRALPGHLGLTTMRERAEIAGGWCEVKSFPRGGTTVEFWLPEP